MQRDKLGISSPGLFYQDSDGGESCIGMGRHNDDIILVIMWISGSSANVRVLSLLCSYVCMYVCMYVHAYVCTYIRMYTVCTVTAI